MENVIVFIKKWGVNGCLVVGLFWMNGRLDVLEERLYDCYEKRVDHVNNTKFNNAPLLAILPSKFKIEKS